MSLTKLKEKVLKANLDLVKKDLVISTWGNVSAYDEKTDLVVIKASGIPYDELGTEHMTVVDLEGNIVEGEYAPSTDTITHIELYKKFKDKGIRGIVHTHSQNATAWAQLGIDVPIYGTTHADYFYGDIPCTRLLKPEEIETDYEKNTGKVILERMESMDCRKMSAILVNSHGPFVWGNSANDAINNSEVLEYITKMAFMNYISTNGTCPKIQKELLKKHYDRKFGDDAYYGQKKVENNR